MAVSALQDCRWLDDVRVSADDGVVPEVAEFLGDLLLGRGLLQLELVAPVHVRDVRFRAVFLHVRGDLLEFGVELRKLLVLEHVDALRGVGVEGVVAVERLETLVIDGAERVVDDTDLDAVDVDDGVLFLVRCLEGAGGLEALLAKDLDRAVQAFFAVVAAVVVGGDEEVKTCVLQSVCGLRRQLEVRIEIEVAGFGDGELKVADSVVRGGDLVLHVREDGVEIISV